MKNIFRVLYFFYLPVLFISCGGSGGATDEEISTAVSSVYLSGGTDTHAIYWKDATVVSLASGTVSSATSIFVTDSDDVYTAGRYLDSGPTYTACYWTGDTKTDLSSPAATTAVATSIFVSGTDIYVSGYYESGGTYTACYWKNGTMTTLDGSWTSAIFVYGTDVYVAGSGGGVDTPFYWKNGIKVVLSSSEGEVDDIKVVDGNVYAVGEECVDAGCSKMKAVYWLNSNATDLTDGTSSAVATSISVSGTDAYIVGFYQGLSKLAYWKNNADNRIDLDVGTYSVDTPGLTVWPWLNPKIFVKDGDVYVAGRLLNGSDNVGAYWKNGELTTSVDQKYSGIFVK